MPFLIPMHPSFYLAIVVTDDRMQDMEVAEHKTKYKPMKFALKSWNG